MELWWKVDEVLVWWLWKYIGELVEDCVSVCGGDGGLPSSSFKRFSRCFREEKKCLCCGFMD